MVLVAFGPSIPLGTNIVTVNPDLEDVMFQNIFSVWVASIRPPLH